MPKRLMTAAGGVVYWAVAVWFLRQASPVGFDGAGPVPSFHWGAMPLPSFGEYIEHQHYYDAIYWGPYLWVGLVETLVGYVAAPRLARRWGWSAAGAAGLTLGALLLLAVISDLGGEVDWWRAPQFILHFSIDRFTLAALAKVMLPATVLSWAFAAEWPEWRPHSAAT